VSWSSALDLEADLNHRLELSYFTALNRASEGRNLEPLHLLHRLCGFRNGISHGIREALRRLTDHFNKFPNQTLTPLRHMAPNYFDPVYFVIVHATSQVRAVSCLGQ